MADKSKGKKAKPIDKVELMLSDIGRKLIRIESKLDLVMRSSAREMVRRPTTQEAEAINAGGGNPADLQIHYKRSLLDEWEEEQRALASVPAPGGPTSKEN